MPWLVRLPPQLAGAGWWLRQVPRGGYCWGLLALLAAFAALFVPAPVGVIYYAAAGFFERKEPPWLLAAVMVGWSLAAALFLALR